MLCPILLSLVVLFLLLNVLFKIHHNLKQQHARSQKYMCVKGKGQLLVLMRDKSSWDRCSFDLGVQNLISHSWSTTHLVASQFPHKI